MFEFSVAKVSDFYDAGLPDVKGPKHMRLIFYKNRVEITYLTYVFFTKKIILNPSDILELSIGVQDTNITGNAMVGAMAGGLAMGGLGALAVAGAAAKRRKEDSLHLVIRYKGEPRPLYFQNTKKAQKLYLEFNKLYTPRQIKQMPSTVGTKNMDGSDIAKQLTDLNSLVEKGILTQEEFEIQKKAILSKATY